MIRAEDRHVSKDSAVPSDIIPGEYEGGYKIWECSIDLSRYIASLGSDSIVNKRIIELGSGQGMPGVTAMALGAALVHFQDYDADVVEALTIPVVQENMNLVNLPSQKRCETRFFAGDWGTLSTHVLEGLGLTGTYDIVLTSETIYNVDSMSRLLQCIQQVRYRLILKTMYSLMSLAHGYCVLQCLQKPDGICFLAAKSFYFGVGGGIAAFKSLVDRDGCMKHETALVIDDGKSNRREIIKLSFR